MAKQKNESIDLDMGVLFDDIIRADLQDDEFCRAYLNNALQESDPQVFLIALGRVAKARDMSITEVARQLQVNRQGIYHALSDKGNPGWNTLFKLLHLMGFDLQLVKRQTA